MAIKAVGFDLDDTLYNRSDFYRHVYDVMQTTVIPLEVSFEEFYEVFQRYSDEEYELFIRRKKDKKSYKNDRVIHSYQYFGKKITEEVAIIFNSLYLYYRDQLTFRPGVSECLKYLLKQNMQLFILTNGPSVDQRQKLQQLDLSRWIPEEHWYISDEIGFSKPDEELFRFVENKLSLESQEILYIGDHLENDVWGANRVGWDSLYLNIHQTDAPPKVKNCTDFPMVLREITYLLTHSN